jgi:hypothetical protein
MKKGEMLRLLERIPTKALQSEVGRRNAALRVTHAGGRPKIVKLCPGCREPMGVREYKAHKCKKETR